MSLLSDDARRNQLASDWMHQGMDFAKESSGPELERAVRCFDEAIALRQALPLQENHFFRYGLSAGWINRGDALARLTDGRFAGEAVKSYDEALTLLESLPLEANVLYPRRLAITWINRGIALQQQEISRGMWEAAECFREAISVLEHPSAFEVADRAALLAGAWGNLANVLMNSGEEDAEGIRSAAHQALALAKFSERKDLALAEIGLKARHVLCRLAVKNLLEKKPLSRAVVGETTDAVDEAMALMRFWMRQGAARFAPITREIFRFGCRIYGSSQPHFLAEFLMECFSPAEFGRDLVADEETREAAQAAIWSVLGNLQIEGFGFVSTTEFEPFLADIRELRLVEERLGQLRHS